MKKIISLLLILFISVQIFTACSGKPDPDSDPDISSSNSSNENKNTLDGIEENESPYDLVTMRASDYDFSTMDAKTFAYALGIGWNLGETFDATGGDGIDPISQETSWGNPATSQALIQAVADYGFTTIRIPITWYHFVDSEYHIDEAFLARIKQVVDWSLDEGLFVIINTQNEEDWLVPGEGEYEAVSNRLCTMWSQIGEYFADYDERLVFEAMSAPRVGNDWEGNETTHKVVNKLGNDFVATIRSLDSHNKTRFLMVPCYASSQNPDVWKEYEFPEDDRVIFSLYAYLPYTFTSDINGTGSLGAEPLDSDLLSYNIESEFTDEFTIYFSALLEILFDNDRACALVETGCMSKNNIDDRVIWANYMTSWAVICKVPIMWWDNGKFSNGEPYGLIDRETYQSPYEEIITTMLETWYLNENFFD